MNPSIDDCVFSIAQADVQYLQDEVDRLTEFTAGAYSVWAGDQIGVARDAVYYQRILIPVLIKLIPVIYHKVETVKQSAANVDLTALVGRDTAGFLRGVMEEGPWHEAVRSLVICSMSGEPMPEFAGSGMGDPCVVPAVNWKDRVKALGCQILLYNVPLYRADLVKLALADYGRTNHWFSPDIPSLKVTQDPDMRCDLHGHLVEYDLSSLPGALREKGRVILDILPYVLPVDYVELLRHCREWAHGMADICTPKALVAGYSFLQGGGRVFYAAEVAARGALTIGWQHGGNYGETLTPGRCERWERRLNDRFITWGWDDGDAKLRPAPDPRQRLHKRKRLPRKGKSRLLWVTTTDSRYTHFFDHSPVGDRLKGYFSHQDRLAQAMPDKMRANVTLRLNKRNFCWDMKGRLMAQLSGAEISSPLRTLLAEGDMCGMVLIDYPGSTAFLECLAAGLPFVGVFDPEVYGIRDCQRAAFEQLEANGVIHKRYDTAVEEITRALVDPEAWMSVSSRKAALTEIRDIVMRRDPGYVTIWRKIFRELPDNAL